MTTSALPLLERGGHRAPAAREECRVRPVFVTQSEDTRHIKGDNVRLIHAEAPSRVLEDDVTRLLKTLVLNKQADLNEVNKRLALKRQEFKDWVEVRAQRRAELEAKQQQTRAQAMKFERFVADNEAKRRRAREKCDAAREENAAMQRQIEELSVRLRQLGARKQLLQQQMEKYKIYEDYLMKTLKYFPDDYLDSGSESLVMPIVRRHETLSATHRALLQRLGRMEEELEEGVRLLRSMKQEHGIATLMAGKELSDLQSKLEALKEENKQMEVKLQMEHGLSREKAEEVGRLLMAVHNLAEQCYLPAYGPLESMSVLTMMDMVKEYILDKADTERRARRLMEAESAATSTAERAARKASVKSTGSKTQLKSSSKASKKSEVLT